MMELNRYQSLSNNNDKATTVNVCFGKDWYRYPSSFFLPNTNWHVRFVQSEFDGILPAPYASDTNATRLIHQHFNDQNQANPNLYFDLMKCHFMLDFDNQESSELEPIYANAIDRWKIMKSFSFLNAGKSNRFFRTFYVPFLNDKYVVYGNFSLLQANKLKIH